MCIDQEISLKPQHGRSSWSGCSQVSLARGPADPSQFAKRPWTGWWCQAQAGVPLRSLPCHPRGLSNTNIRIFSSCCPTSIFLLLDKNRGERRLSLQKHPVVTGCLLAKITHLSGDSLPRSTCLQQHRVSAAPGLPLLCLPVRGQLTGISVLTKFFGRRSNLWPARPFWTLFTSLEAPAGLTGHGCSISSVPAWWVSFTGVAIGLLLKPQSFLGPPQAGAALQCWILQESRVPLEPASIGPGP